VQSTSYSEHAAPVPSGYSSGRSVLQLDFLDQGHSLSEILLNTPDDCGGRTVRQNLTDCLFKLVIPQVVDLSVLVYTYNKRNLMIWQTANGYSRR
jgi:hypothetical protein